MRLIRYIFPAIYFTSTSSARPASSKTRDGDAVPLPLIIWHGLGDKFDNEGLQSTAELASKVNPGTYVYIIRLDDDDSGKDQKATFFGNVSAQVGYVCEKLRLDPALRSLEDPSTMRVDAMGFSQGGQFLRGLVQTCEGLSVRSLVTFGSQHNGIAEFQACGTWDFLCRGASSILRGNAWTEYAQGNVVPAQYYRTVNQTTGLASDEYLRASGFLADINNERKTKNVDYAKRLQKLEKFVMYVFEEDQTVIPKESGWFAEVNMTTGDVTPLRNRPIYREDWLGLKELDDKGALVFRSTPGRHMALDKHVLTEAYKQYFGREMSKGDIHLRSYKWFGLRWPEQWYSPTSQMRTRTREYL